MPLNGVKGNMYDWVTHTLTIVRGCVYRCKYCYVRAIPQYDMTPKLVEKDFEINLGAGKRIFVGSTGDMFGEAVPGAWITRVLLYLKKFPGNEYLFQTKNPVRYLFYLRDFPSRTILATTIETTDERYLILAK